MTEQSFAHYAEQSKINIRVIQMSSITLTTAFLITQFFLLVIVYVGILALNWGEKRRSAITNNAWLVVRSLPLLALGFSLITLACLVFSQEIILSSKPAFGGVEFPALPRAYAFLIVFGLDILGAGILMSFTGGSKDSPFSAVLFALPTLSIFLRETPTRFFAYTIMSVCLFLMFARPNKNCEDILENPKHRMAFQLVTLGCLALSTLVGYAMRPQ